MSRVWMLLGLVGCGDEAGRTGLPPWDAAPTVPDVPSEVASAESRAFEMNFGGGGSGAPYGLNFFLPPGVVAEPKHGLLSDGSKGFSLTVPAFGEAVVCSAPVRMRDRITLTTRMRVAEITPTTEAWSGADVEVRARDAQGQIVVPGGTRFVIVKHQREASDWSEWSAEVEIPEGAVQGEVCYRFVKATGTLEVDRLVVESPGVPLPAVVPIVAADWRLDEPGGGGGAPQGFSFLIPPGTQGASFTLFRDPPTAPEAPVFGETAVTRGLTMAVSTPSNALVCSTAFSVAPGMQVRGRVRVRDITTDARAWTGFVAEIRTYDLIGGLASAAATPFTLLRAWKTGGDWEEFTEPFAPPKGATNGKLCFRFVESTGTADVDWVAVGE